MMNVNYDGRSPWRIIVRVIAVLSVVGGGLVMYRSQVAGGSGTAPTTSTIDRPPLARPAPPLSHESAESTTTAAPASVTAPTAPTSTAPTSTASTTSTTANAATTATTVAVGPSTTTPRPPVSGAPGHTASTMPDGSAVPVVAVFDVNTITLSGAVPSQAAADRLAALTLANSKTPAAVANFLTVDPAVPASVGVRVVELTSARFPEGSADVVGAHAKELDRMAMVMAALPNTTTLVIGHADQLGSAAANFTLSEARARAVVNFLIHAGIDPTRLSSRAVGERDPLTTSDDATGLAMNRRTEFVVYGLLIG